MGYMKVDIVNRPFLQMIIKEVKLSKILSGGEKSVLLTKINDDSFLETIKNEFNQGLFAKEDTKKVIEYIKGE